jgi:hypothetical protein
LFVAHGVGVLPRAIRSDNGVPFASPNALFNLSKLSVWWLRLGIAIERIKPGHPQQNGRHERMHLTLKKEATRPPGLNSLQQQDRFDAFVREFNTERPHEALDMKCPAQLYTTSTRHYDGLPELTYPFHDRDVLVTACGRLCLHRKRINISLVLAGQKLGIKEVDFGCGQPAGVNRRARLPSDLQPNFAAIDPRRQQFFLLRRQVADLARSDPRDVDADVAAGVSHVGPRASAAPPFFNHLNLKGPVNS